MKHVLCVEWPLLAAVVVLSPACGSSSATGDAGPPQDAGLGAETSDEGDAGAMDSGPSEAAATDSGGGFVPSNVPLASIPAGAGDVTITTSACVVDTDMLTVGCVTPGSDGGLPYVFVAAQQSDGSPVAILAVNSLPVSPSSSLSVKGGVPLIVWSRTTVNIQGSLIAEQPFRETNGGGAGQTQSGAGGGPGGGIAATANPEIGGGGGGYCGTGGAGANSQTVSGDGGAPSAGGKAYGNATITPLIGGSSGGGLGAGLEGGEGGGAIEITAGQSILIGSGGVISVPGYGATGNGGGGGSGGAILLEAPAVTVDGALAANGGGAAVFSGGGGAQDGQPNTQAAKGEDANSAVGSAGTQIQGADGAATPTFTSAGGGGAGRIRINTTTGAATFGASAITSPDVSTTCVSQGTLTK
jgi:hypothetical protein